MATGTSGPSRGDHCLAGELGLGRAFTVPGDYNGDGRADLGAFDRSSGKWYVKTISGPVLANALAFGNGTSVAVPGNYGGGPSMDLAMFDRATGNWNIRTLGGLSILSNMNWGWSETTPVRGDYDGDGTNDLAVYHGLTGNWYIKTVKDITLAFATNWVSTAPWRCWVTARRRSSRLAVTRGRGRYIRTWRAT